MATPQKSKLALDNLSEAVSGTTAAKITPTQLGYLLVHAATCPAVYQSASASIDNSFFSIPKETSLLLFWQGLTAVANSDAGIPKDRRATKDLLHLHCEQACNSDIQGSFYTSDVVEEVFGDGGLLDSVVGLAVTEETEQAALQLLLRFVSERSWSDPFRRSILAMTDNDTIVDPGQVIDALQKQASRLLCLSKDPGSLMIMDGVDFAPPSVKTMPTGLEVLDGYLNGGHANDEAYIVLANSSQGKSAVGLQVALAGVRYQLTHATEPGQAGYWYIFSYELTIEQMRIRTYAQGAKIQFSSLAGGFQNLTTSQNLLDYEHSLFVNPNPSMKLGEKERLANFARDLGGSNCRLITVDYSTPADGLGTGGVDEIVRYLKTQEHLGRRIAGVVIDYAGLCLERYVAAKNLKPGTEFTLLNNFMDVVRGKISIKFHCPTWVLHQMHGSTAARPPGIPLHHRDAQGARNIGNNADFAICLGNRDEKSNLLVTSCTKHRRSAGHDAAKVVQFEPQLYCFRTPDNEYVVDSMTKQFVLASDVGKFADFAPANNGNKPNSRSFANDGW